MPVFASLPLRTNRLLLRPLRESDADAMLGIFSDPEVMRFWGSVPWSSRDEALERIAKDAQRLEEGTDLRLGLERLTDATFLGTCTLFDFNAQCRRAEIGYCLASAAWGQGYMHEALTSLIQYGFKQLDLNRIEADIDPRNEASARSLERLMFKREGLLRERWIVGSEVSDSALYGLLRVDWLARGTRRDRDGSL